MDAVWDTELCQSRSHGLTQQLLDSSSDEEDETPQWGGSLPGKAPNIERYREDGAQRLYKDYFAVSSVYNEQQFRRRFRVMRRLFDTIVDGVHSVEPYFVQRQDATGRWGLSTLQKATCAFRLLAYGSAADSTDEYLRLGESTAAECLKKFAKAVITRFGDLYLRYPTIADMRKLLALAQQRGFPGMMGSIDCCKWRWKNCPTALQGQYQGKEGEPVITLEAIADRTLWIWHAFFGMPGVNDINVLEASPLSNEIASGNYPPPVEYVLAGERRKIPYWLADGIYPKWPMFLHTVSQPTNQKEELLASRQESVRKDVERAFGVLQSKWHIVARPSRLWYKSVMHDVMRCCIILHNMMVENRILEEDVMDGASLDASTVVGENASHMWQDGSPSASLAGFPPPPGSIAALCALQKLTANESEYYKTRRLAMKHLWDTKGNDVL